MIDVGLWQFDLFIVMIWLKDMCYFVGLNVVWNVWVDVDNLFVWICVLGELYCFDLFLEIVVVVYCMGDVV